MEFALIVPIVAGLVMVAMDFSNAWAFRLQLEQAAQRGIELVAVRRGVAPSYDYVRTETINAWGLPYTSAVVDHWLECGGVRAATLTSDCGTAQRARYVSVSITANFRPTFGWGGIINGNVNGGFNLTGDAAVRVQ